MAAILRDTTIPANGDVSTTSDIHVIVVGAGFAGLTAAIECRRKGFKVTLFESFKALKPLGDIISFGGNGGRIFDRWEGVSEKLDPICHRSDGLAYYDYKGKHIYTQIWADEREWGKKYNGHRGEIHEIVWNHALAKGVDIQLGRKVEEYFEEDDRAGVIIDGQRFIADVVVAADGVRSTARKIVLGQEDKPKSSGYAIYRAWYSAEDIRKNQMTAWLCENGDRHAIWLGPDIHFIVATVKAGREVSWVMTHKDDADVEESWSYPGSVEDALKVVEGWDPLVHAIIRTTPEDRLVDWKLVFRDPLPTWISPKARIALIGDAAHPFLPTSIQGASQSMEDGVTIAACLDIAGKANIPEAVRVFERIRYKRVKKAQATGVTTRDQWHKADFDKIHANPIAVKLPREQWLLGFDAEAHAYNVYSDVADEIRDEALILR